MKKSQITFLIINILYLLSIPLFIFSVSRSLTLNPTIRLQVIMHTLFALSSSITGFIVVKNTKKYKLSLILAFIIFILVFVFACLDIFKSVKTILIINNIFSGYGLDINIYEQTAVKNALINLIYMTLLNVFLKLIFPLSYLINILIIKKTVTKNQSNQIN